MNCGGPQALRAGKQFAKVLCNRRNLSAAEPATSPQVLNLQTVLCNRVVRVDIGVVTYKAMTPQSGMSVVQVLVVSVDIGVVTDTSVLKVGGSGPGRQSGYRSGDI